MSALAHASNTRVPRDNAPAVPLGTKRVATTRARRRRVPLKAPAATSRTPISLSAAITSRESDPVRAAEPRRGAASAVWVVSEKGHSRTHLISWHDVQCPEWLAKRCPLVRTRAWLVRRAPACP